MAVLNTGLAKTSAGGFTIDNSCRFDDGSSVYFRRTSAGAGNQKTWTFSCWVKKYKGSNATLYQSVSSQGVGTAIGFMGSNGEFGVYQYIASYAIRVLSSGYHRDPTAWYHCVVAMDTTQEVEANRVKIYINGSQITDLGYSVYPSQDTDYQMNQAGDHGLCASFWDGSITEYMDLQLAEVHMIDGTALTPSSFGEFGDYGEWKPIEVTGLTYGTNGFYLDFSDSAALGDDAAGSNDFTLTNLVATDQMLDTPTNNFCTLNPLANTLATTLSEGNLKSVPTYHNDKVVWSTFGFTSGKWYVEVHDTNQGDALGGIIGISDTYHAGYLSTGDDNSHIRMGNGLHTTTGTDNGDTTAGVTGDIFTIAVDADIGSVWYAKNAAPDTSTTAQATGLDTTPIRDYRFGHQESNAAGGTGYTQTTWNFGQDSSFAGEETAQGNADGNGYGDFYYSPPSGYLALCTANLDTPAVIPSEHFNTVLWTGDHSNPRSFTGVGFQPDFVVSKARTIGWSHSVFDSVRGGNKQIYTNNTAAEDSDNSNGYIDTFDSDGITIANTAGYVVFNYSATAYANWFWKANGSGSANTDGDMAETVTVSANTDAGFSIVNYTGDGSEGTVGHGLSKAPEMILFKNRDSISDWMVYNKDILATYILVLQTTAAKTTAASAFANTAPTSTVFTVNTNAGTNTDDDKYIAYCFHSVDGYSKVGSYEGNGDADGTFVYTGFRPAFVLTKSVDSTSDWSVFDNERLGYNEDNDAIGWNLSDDATTTTTYLDLLSNGFKCRIATDPNVAESYIYLAFAETPFKYSNAR